MKCEVLALDNDEARVVRVRDDVQRAMIADVRDLDMLKSVITDKVDEVVVCLGESMEPSILCTLHLSQIGVRKIRAKAANNDHATILKAIGAHEVIFPERETAERTARRIAHPHLLDYFPLSEEYRIIEIVTPESLVGKTLLESELRRTYHLFVLAIKSRPEGKYHFMPEANDVLRESDVLVVLGREVDLARFSALD
jgi:trk system potassium uptake protein TrkA